VPEGNLTLYGAGTGTDRLGVESSEIIKSLFFKGSSPLVTQTLDSLHDPNGRPRVSSGPVLEDDVQEAAKRTVEMTSRKRQAALDFAGRRWSS